MRMQQIRNASISALIGVSQYFGSVIAWINDLCPIAFAIVITA